MFPGAESICVSPVAPGVEIFVVNEVLEGSIVIGCAADVFGQERGIIVLPFTRVRFFSGDFHSAFRGRRAGLPPFGVFGGRVRSELLVLVCVRRGVVGVQLGEIAFVNFWC